MATKSKDSTEKIRATEKNLTDVALVSGNFRRGKALVLPSLSIAKLNQGDSIFVNFIEEPVTKPQMDKKGKQMMDDDGETPLNITTAQVVDMTTGALSEVVLGYVVCKALAQHTPLTGKSFEFVKGPKKNRTVMWEVYELDAA